VTTSNPGSKSRSADTDARAFEGGCLCRSTRFRVSGEIANRCYCHCRSCQLASGAPFVAWATFPADRFEEIEGRLAWCHSSPSVTRGFCPACGTTLTYRHEARANELDVAIAALDDPSAVRPEFHLWVSHKLPWVELGDDLPRYDEWRTSGA